jgi:hypothetical protein
MLIQHGVLCQAYDQITTLLPRCMQLVRFAGKSIILDLRVREDERERHFV